MNSICKNASNVVEYGDVVVLYSSEKVAEEMVIKERGKYETHFGVWKHSSIVGCKYGQKVYSENKRESVFILKPSSTLHTKVLKHRTQILYAPDISMVLHLCDIKSGSIVVESGTGSASLSMSIAKTVIPSGHLFTFEFNESRVKAAKAEFQDMGLNKFVTCKHRDVLANGFDIKDYKLPFGMTTLEDNVDAVFLDLPSPWGAVKHAKKVLKHNGRICNFSPCIEQVQKVCLELNALEFSHIRTFECLSRAYTSKNHYGDNVNVYEDNDQDEESKYLIKKRRERKSDKKQQKEKESLKDRSKILISEPVAQKTKGHTGYLTFATCNKQLGKLSNDDLETLKTFLEEDQKSDE